MPGTIPVPRIIEKLDACFSRNDLAEAGRLLEYWAAEARSLGDEGGLLSIVNEELGFYRRTDEREKGLAAVEEALSLLGKRDFDIGEGTVLLNAATTLKCFGQAECALPLYERVRVLYEAALSEDSFLLASLYNNMALTLAELGRAEEAAGCFRQAISVLEHSGEHLGEIAVSYVNLAQLSPIDAPETAEAMENAWAYLNRPQPQDANHAFVCAKCAPAFDGFGQSERAEELQIRSSKIYGIKIAKRG